MGILVIIAIAMIWIFCVSFKRGRRCYRCKNRYRCTIKASGNALEVLSCNQFEELEKRD